MIKRILVADDSEAIQKAISIALAPFDVNLFVAASYVDTLGGCRKHQPQLLIVDASLTGTDSSQDFQNLAAAAGGVPMLLLEGSYEPIDRRAFEAMGLNCFLKKPFDTHELLQTLSQRLGANFTKKPAASLPSPPPLRGPQSSSSSRGAVAPPPVRPPLPPPPAPPREGLGHQDSVQQPPPKGRPAQSQNHGGGQNFAGETFAFEESKANLSSPPFTLAPSLNLQEEDPFAGKLLQHPEARGQLPLVEFSTQQEASSQLPHGSTGNLTELQPLIAAMVAEELQKQLYQAVATYCEGNFRPIAREVIREELRRLADERARHLVDN